MPGPSSTGPISSAWSRPCVAYSTKGAGRSICSSSASSPALAGLPNVGFVPYNDDYPAFLRALSRVDWSFGIAPLADLPSRHGKSDNKYREYGACRIPAHILGLLRLPRQRASTAGPAS